MASSDTTSKKQSRECIICVENSDGQKVKPAVAMCDGCRQLFCHSHFNQHREKLNERLDEITGQRNVLQSRLKELPAKVNDEYIKKINDWKKSMLQTVNEAVTDAERQVHQHVLIGIQREFDEITTKITSLRSDDNCVETDLEQLQTKINKLENELSDSKSLQRLELNFPNLACSNMVQIKLIEEKPSKSEVNLESVSSDNVEKYSSFIETFIKTRKPFTDLTLNNMNSGHLSASPTMQIIIDLRQVERLVFDGQSKTTFSWTHGNVLDIRWSSVLQRFIVLTASKIVVIDALEKKDQVVLDMKDFIFKNISHWKTKCILTDHMDRLFMYEMGGNNGNWLLLYCWSKPTTCAFNECITAIGLNDKHIVLGIKNEDQYKFAVYTHLMAHRSTIQLDHPCTTIQTMPDNEWLISDLSKQYYVIDSKLNEHAELYLSNWEGYEVFIDCDQPNRLLIVLLSYKQAQESSYFYQLNMDERIEVYISNT